MGKSRPKKSRPTPTVRRLRADTPIDALIAEVERIARMQRLEAAFENPTDEIDPGYIAAKATREIHARHYRERAEGDQRELEAMQARYIERKRAELAPVG